MEAAVFEGLRLGTRTLNELHSEMSLEAVEELMEDTRAALQHQEVGWHSFIALDCLAVCLSHLRSL